ncbi:MAG: GNAT family N-acetyltransferase [Candidatus Latescibacteria bacterium]|nr:GNAT family N-acetyltransferase [Candidatus Latescibacterota bacterium]
MKIKRATREDIPVLGQLVRSVHDLHAEAKPDLFKAWTQEAGEEDFKRFFDDKNWAKNSRVFIVYDPAPVAYMVVFIYDWPESNLQFARGSIYIYHIAVKEEARRQGYATALVNRAKDLAKELNMPRVELDMWSFNTAAKAFYQSQGFATIEEKMSIEL